jgi:hypothetical protein
MRSRKRSGSLAAAVLALIAPAGCARDRLSADEHAARTAVVRYNESLVQAYRTGNRELMRDVAALEEVERIGNIVASLAAAGRTMEARQTGFRVLGVTINEREDGVTLVETLETWTYEHRALADRDRPAPAKEAKYRLAYNLVRAGGRFVVHRIVEHELPPGERER